MEPSRSPLKQSGHTDGAGNAPACPEGADFHDLPVEPRIAVLQHGSDRFRRACLWRPNFCENYAQPLAHLAHLPVPTISLLHLGHFTMSAQGVVALHLGHLQEADAQAMSLPQPGHFMVLPTTPMAS